ncbi:hypothetical protein FB45DRAFT_925794 [Roridomyces roridus]|uniref:J domain-containing protein n=1 Tax=Roridomyces roridus TaxID=1738132 RepID=A0AAD7BK09_9AGAR|nr:hypothetical protein FB45DRAFT_925794 [Roridomyces roridus]
MAQFQFYETLDIPRDATPEQIRKAYKKCALNSHPDRLAPGFTPDEKLEAEEKFRNVSNAYEVLKDPETRRLYDTNGGVWPPPQTHSARPQPHRSGPVPNRHNRFPPNPFEDFLFMSPFEMFDRMFGDYRRPSYHPMHRSSSNRYRDPFEAIYRIQDMMADMERDMLAFPSSNFGRSRSIGFEGFGGGGGMRWASESSTLTSRNGVTHRIHKRRDFDGNEYVTRTYPDGREIHTINGVEETTSSRGYLPPPGPPPPLPHEQFPSNMRLPPPQTRYTSPPPSYHHHSTRSPAHSVHSGRDMPYPGYANRRKHLISTLAVQALRISSADRIWP